MFSVMYGAVRLSTADTWGEAQQALRESIEARIRHMPKGLGWEAWDAKLRAELAELSATADVRLTPHTSLWLSEWDGIVWRDDGKTYGVGIGDLCYVRDVPNGCLGGWTINVKAKIEGIYQYEYGPQVNVRITGESLQFRRYGSVSLAASNIRTRQSVR